MSFCKHFFIANGNSGSASFSSLPPQHFPHCCEMEACFVDYLAQTAGGGPVRWRNL